MMEPTDCFARGYERARADVARGWWHQWLMARELAEDAVYAPSGLSEEQRGYAAALLELCPEGGAGLPAHIAEPMRLLDNPLPGQVPLGRPIPQPTMQASTTGRLPGRGTKRQYFQRHVKRRRGKRANWPEFRLGVA